MLKTQFRTLEQIIPAKKSHERIKHDRKADFEDLFFFCTCKHLVTGHELFVGKCYYDNCGCKKFIQADLIVNVEFTMLDLFMMETSNKIFDDSPQFWLNYKIWSENYVK